ncbi:nicotinamide riboside kinase 1 isoform X3 [Falco biarmicus]|uniref:nicotinamide riboside kinase 1 isoform X3 n=1 Tax=Falco rusticolus TaxID=120794 RepID=UPI000FFB72DC|nr:nicotinamide riboside kinase 1 isoform X3 [Falco rusticolus]XP_055555001.1 nicotinamide riboside kinase 1 isoform X3 [Falco cherrug]XP_056180549.1 nicotinamide riboside kinase 1 isoform X3 [Falco biarmicus]
MARNSQEIVLCLLESSGTISNLFLGIASHCLKAAEICQEIFWSVTNGGKTTLSEKLKKMFPNCDVISQDDFFKPESEVETDERGFKLYDVLDALYMDEMVKSIRNWMKSPASSGVVTEGPQNTCDNLKNTDDVYILIVEGFLLYNYEPLNELWNRRYFLTLPYEECKRRRSLLGWNQIPRGASVLCV